MKVYLLIRHDNDFLGTFDDSELLDAFASFEGAKDGMKKSINQLLVARIGFDNWWKSLGSDTEITVNELEDGSAVVNFRAWHKNSQNQFDDDYNFKYTYTIIEMEIVGS